MNAPRIQDEDQTDERLSQVAESFVEEYRQGQQPSIEQYAARYPDLAERLRQLLPTLMVVEELGPIDCPGEGSWDPSIDVAFPKFVGDYRIVREIGRGGMGVVYEAEQISLSRTVALKLLGQRFALNPKLIERFQAEARSTARLHHPRIIPVYDVGKAEGFHFYAMQLINGTGLDQILADLQSMGRLNNAAAFTRPAAEVDSTHQQGISSGRNSESADSPLPSNSTGYRSAVMSTNKDNSRRYYREVARIIMQVAESLGYAHSQGILHRDIKPSNLILDHQGEVWVADFGLAKAYDGTFQDVQGGLTATGDIVGTMRYMAPERLRGWSDPRSDVYALGLTLYELLTLRPAFEESDRIKLMQDISGVEPRPPRKIDARIPRDLETIVLKAMQKEPALRYPSADAMAEDLRSFLEHRSITARRQTRTERMLLWSRHNPALAAMGGVLIAVAIGASVQSWRLGTALRESESARIQARQANVERTLQLRQSLLEQARSARTSALPGAREKALQAVHQAAVIQNGLDLRNEAIAAMALMDIRPTPDWHQPASSPMVAFGPTLDYFIAFDGKQSAVIYDKSREELQRIAATSYDAQFSPDGRYLIFKDSSKLAQTGTESLSLLEWRTGNEILKLGTRFSGRPFDFHPQGQEWAVRTPDGKLVFYSLPDCKELRRFDLPGSDISLAYAPSGDSLAFIERGKPTISTIGAQTGKIQALAVAPAGLLGRISFNPDGSLIAAGCINWRSYVWDARSGELITTLIGHDAEVFATQFAPHSNLLVTSSWDRSYRLWDVTDGRTLSRLEGCAGGFSSDGKQLAFVGGGRLGVLRCASSEEFRIVRGHSGKNPRWCTFSPDGQILVSSGFDGIRLWDVRDGAELGTIPLMTTLSAEFSDAGDFLVTSSASGVRKWPIGTSSANHDRTTVQLLLGPPIQLLDRPTQERRAAINTNGSEIVVVSDDAEFVEVLPLNPSTGNRPDGLTGSDSGRLDVEPAAAQAIRIACGLAPNDCRVSPDGRWLVVSSWLYRWWAVYDLPQRRLVRHFPVTVTPNFAFSPDSRCLVVSSELGAQVYWTTNWSQARDLLRETTGGPYGAVAFSAANSLLAMARSGGDILLLDGSNFEEIARLQSPLPEFIYHLEFNRAGTQLAVCINGGVQLWNLERIRRRLSAMNLDWDPPAPSFSPAKSFLPMQLEIDAGQVSLAE